MPVLADARYELFAQEIAKGTRIGDAYPIAGFRSKGKGAQDNASRLKARPEVAVRIAELKAAAAARCEITTARIMAELGKIGFSDIRKAVQWYSNVAVAAADERSVDDMLEDGPEVRHQITNQVELVSSGEIDDATAAAIAEISMTDKGGLKVKFHDKRAALVDMGKHLGMFTEKHELTGANGGPIQTEELSDEAAVGRMLFLIAKARKEKAAALN